MMIRRLFFLVLALAVGHAVLLWGRRVALVALERTYGFVGLDQQDRARHWYDYHEQFSTILSADEVEQVGLRRGDVATVVRFPARARGGRRVGHRQYRDLSVPSGNVTLSGTLCVIGDRSLSIDVRGDGTVSLFADRRRSTKEIPVAGSFDRFEVLLGGAEGPNFVGIVNDEYWVVTGYGEFLERRRMDFDLSQIESVHAEGDLRGVLVRGKSFRPDRTPLRMIVARPGREVVSRKVVLEPATEEQRWIAACFGVMAALRPVPLAIASVACAEPTDPRELHRAWWIDPYLARGANAGWLLAGICITAVCIWIALRWGRIRCATRRARLLWVGAVALMGPMGLVWMRLALPWAAIEQGRAVNMETHAWPEPQLTGTEVYAIR